MNSLNKFLPIIEIDLKNKQAILNEKAKVEFKECINEIQPIIKSVYLHKRGAGYTYIGKNLYFVKLLEAEDKIDILFIKIDDKSTLLNKVVDSKGNYIDVYPKDALREFLEKFLALKNRFGGFYVQFLYLRLGFLDIFETELKQKVLGDTLKYCMGITRSSDVVGRINEDSFGIILTQAQGCNANLLVDKIMNFIISSNYNDKKLVVEVYGALASELFILKNLDFEVLLSKLKSKAKLIQKGGNVPLIFK